MTKLTEWKHLGWATLADAMPEYGEDVGVVLAEIRVYIAQLVARVEALEKQVAEVQAGGITDHDD